MSLNVCVECGTRVRRLVRKLQFDNYCLEKCVNLYFAIMQYYSQNAKAILISISNTKEI